MLTVNIKGRFTIDGALQHPWIVNSIIPPIANEFTIHSYPSLKKLDSFFDPIIDLYDDTVDGPLCRCNSFIVPIDQHYDQFQFYSRILYDNYPSSNYDMILKRRLTDPFITNIIYL